MGRKSDAKIRLLKAAQEAFWARSCHAVSVDLLCKEAGVNKGSFYHFFQSKQALILETLNFHWEQVQSSIFKLESDPANNPLLRIEALFDRLYQQQKEIKQQTGVVPGCLFLRIGSEMGNEDPAVRTRVEYILRKQEAYIEAALRAAVEKERFPADPTTAARAVYTILCGLLTRARILDKPEVILEGMTEALAPAGVKESAVA